MRMTMYAQPIQKSGSKAFIENRLIDGQKARRHQHRQRRETLGEAPPAEFPAPLGRQQHHRAARHGRQETDGRSDSPSSARVTAAITAISGG